MGGLFDALPPPQGRDGGEAGASSGKEEAPRSAVRKKAQDSDPPSAGEDAGRKRQKLGVRFDEDAGRDKPKAKAVTIEAALKKIASHIGQKAKCFKSCRLLLQLLQSKQMNTQNSSSFFEVLRASMEDPKLSAEPELRRIYRKVFLVAESNIKLFEEAEQEWVKAYSLLAIVRNELFTDDSFLFNKRMNFVKAQLEGVGTGQGDASRRAWEREALVDCLETAKSFYKLRPWSRTTTDLVTKLAFDQSHHFDDAQKERIRTCWVFVDTQKNQRKGVQQKPASDRRPTLDGETAFDSAVKVWESKAGISKRSGQGGGESWRQAENSLG